MAKTDKIVLLNKGKRTIHGKHPDGRPFVFKPEMAGGFDPATAEKLHRLYPEEVRSLEDMQKQFDTLQADAQKEPEQPPPPPVDTRTREEKIADLQKELQALSEGAQGEPDDDADDKGEPAGEGDESHSQE